MPVGNMVQYIPGWWCGNVYSIIGGWVVINTSYDAKCNRYSSSGTATMVVVEAAMIQWRLRKWNLDWYSSIYTGENSGVETQSQ